MPLMNLRNFETVNIHCIYCKLGMFIYILLVRLMNYKMMLRWNFINNQLLASPIVIGSPS